MTALRGFLLLLFVCLLNIKLSTCNVTIEKNAIEILDNFIPKNYSKAIRPNYGGKPVNVSISMYIIGVSDVSEKSQQFRTQFYLRHQWIDERLAFEPKPGVEQVFINEKLVKKIWLPDSFFANVKTLNHHKTIVTADDAEFCRVSSNGQVLLSKMLDLVAGCQMNLENFPFDSQVCTIELESYGYSKADIEYNWRDTNAAAIGRNVSSMNFRITGLRQSNIVEKLSTGHYSRLTVQIAMSRNATGYIWQLYLPAFLLVLLSWIPLWLSASKHPARIGFSLLILVAFIILSSNHSANLPVTPYLKSIDVYLLASFLMICLSLVECSLVTVLGTQCKYESFNLNGDKQDKTNCMDKWARWIIPAICIVYYVLYGIQMCCLK